MGGKGSKLKREFEVEKVLGSGGFGMVVQAKNKYDTTSYAIKLIVETDERALARSKNEIVLFSQISSHQHVVSYKAAWTDTIQKATVQKLVKDVKMNADEAKRLHFIGQAPRLNILCIQMELCGPDMRSWLLTIAVNERTVNERRQWKIFGQLVKGLGHIHRHNVIHRDLKPENIFVGDHDVKIGDLGVAKALTNDLPVHSNLSVVGTVTHMAPEQFSGQYGKSADVFSLGIVLTEMFSMLKTRDELIHLISSLRCGVVPPHIVKEWPSIANLILRMVENDPDKRINLEDVAKEFKVIKKEMLKDLHVGIRCDGCGQDPIRGMRFSCNDCEDYDLCEKCNETQAHDSSHSFSPLEEEDTQMNSLMQLMSFVKQSSEETHTAEAGNPSFCTNCKKKLTGKVQKCKQCPNSHYCCKACLLLSAQHRKIHKFDCTDLNSPAGLFQIENSIRNRVLLEVLRRAMQD